MNCLIGAPHYLIRSTARKRPQKGQLPMTSDPELDGLLKRLAALRRESQNLVAQQQEILARLDEIFTSIMSLSQQPDQLRERPLSFRDRLSIAAGLHTFQFSKSSHRAILGAGLRFGANRKRRQGRWTF